MPEEMDSERWRRAQEVLDAALDLAPEEREAYLGEACGEDVSLAELVRSLLAQERDDSFLERPAVDVHGVLGDTGPMGSASAGLTAGDRVGPYRVLRELGRGGMGVVWEAEQERPVRRRVALKLVLWGMDTKQVVARFESERQALALMNHKNIASVYDAGASEQGRPYFAMEYVPGGAITRYCDASRLALRERLELFVQVCEGIQHAHQKGVIHRDIKPANVLVTLQAGPPVPKIIDFGVAKATAQRLTERTLSTELGQMIGTPSYMSPEQADLTNPDIDTRTDVYSLGALLYELLVGVPPIAETSGPGFDELLRRIREDDPPVPSARVRALGSDATAACRSTDAMALARALRGDLDWIVMKALAKDRGRRYAAAMELAEDIRRHLAHEPVLAGPPEASYRLGKFVRRHRVGVTAGVLVGAASVVAAVATTLGLLRARRAERGALGEAAKARAINGFLQEVLGAAHPELGSGRKTTVLEALEAGAARVEESFKGQPEIEAAVRHTIGATYSSLGRYDEAEAQLREALRLRRELHGEIHYDVADTLDELAIVCEHTGQLAVAIDSHRTALETFRQLLPGDHPQAIACLSNLATALYATGDFEAAEPLLREAVALRRRTELRRPEGMTNLGNLAVILGHRGQLDEAESLFREAVALGRSLPSGRHPYLGAALNNWGRFLERERNDCARAEQLYREAIDIYRDTMGPTNWMTSHVRSNLGLCLMKLGRWEEAEQELLAALEGMEAAFGPDDERTKKVRERLDDLHRLSQAAEARRRTAIAV